uniref:Uncharacterized protein n=1 Tax=Kalanchoe fedtschenkoi TaxID=63787 RepID=A0A7N0TZN9_KALFE
MSKRHSVRALALARALTPSSHHFCTAAESSSQFPLKHVTRSNFEASLEDLRRHVKAADFVSIDLEMTGLTSAPWRDSFEFDRCDVKYLKVKDSAEKFAVLQFGVCPFRWDSEKQSLVANPYNFYIFPSQEAAAGSRSSGFMCQTSSLEFLARYQFDFNACVKEGISYLSREQEDEAVRRLELEVDKRSSGFKEEPLVKVADVLFTQRMQNKFKVWREMLLQIKHRDSTVNCSDKEWNQQFETFFYKMRPSLVLNGFTFYQLRLIQLVLRQHFDDLAYVCDNTANSSLQHLVVYTESQDDKDLLLEELKDDPLSESKKKIKSGVGFRHVIDLLSSEQKLIVGHNCFLDFAHIYDKFVGPLPSTAEEFVSRVHSCFPYVIDTKRLLTADGYLQYLMKKSSTTLSKAYAIFCLQDAAELKIFSSSIKTRVKVEVQVDEMSSSSWNSGAKHEAGYDAFMTGCIFAQACSHLGFDFKTCSSSTRMAHSKYLEKHVNLLYLSWKSGDIINLCTQEKTTEFSISRKHKRKYPAIVFPNILVIWGFPQTLKANDIKQSLCKTLGASSVTSVYDLDDSAVFVQFSKAELVSEFINMKEKFEKKNDMVSVLHPLSTLLDGGKTSVAGYEVYKEICSQPMSNIRFADQAEALRFKWTAKSIESTSNSGGESESENLIIVADEEPEPEPGSGMFLTDQWMKSYQQSPEEDEETEAVAGNSCEISLRS